MLGATPELESHQSYQMTNHKSATGPRPSLTSKHSWLDGLNCFSGMGKRTCKTQETVQREKVESPAPFLTKLMRRVRQSSNERKESHSLHVLSRVSKPSRTVVMQPTRKPTGNQNRLPSSMHQEVNKLHSGDGNLKEFAPPGEFLGLAWEPSKPSPHSYVVFTDLPKDAKREGTAQSEGLDCHPQPKTSRTSNPGGGEPTQSSITSASTHSRLNPSQVAALSPRPLLPFEFESSP